MCIDYWKGDIKLRFEEVVVVLFQEIECLLMVIPPILENSAQVFGVGGQGLGAEIQKLFQLLTDFQFLGQLFLLELLFLFDFNQLLYVLGPVFGIQALHLVGLLHLFSIHNYNKSSFKRLLY